MALPRILQLAHSTDNTTIIENNQIATAKDIAINGNLEDLASKRGQLGNLSIYSGDANLQLISGTWGITSITASDPNLNYPVPERNSGRIGIFTVLRREIVAFQKYEGLSSSLTGGFVYERLILDPGKPEQVIGNWVARIVKTGDGITINNGIISVPEMEGATSTQNGTSGLVPPPLKTDVGKTLSAEGNWIYPADIAISNNQSDLASTRGIFDTLTKGSVDCNTLTKQGVYAVSLAGTVNGPGFSAKLIVFNGKNSKFVNQMALATATSTSVAIRVAYRSKDSENIWSP